MLQETPQAASGAPSVHDPVAEEAPRQSDLLLAGVVVAAIALAVMVIIAYRTFYLESIGLNTGVFALGLLFCIFAGGAYAAAYAWERGDVMRALRLTAVVLVISVLALIVAVAALALLRGAARGAGGAARGARGGADAQPALRVIGSAMEDWGLPAVFGSTAPRRAPDAAAERPFVIRCERCGESYTPAPPRAACPACGWNAVKEP